MRGNGGDETAAARKPGAVRAQHLLARNVAMDECNISLVHPMLRQGFGQSPVRQIALGNYDAPV